MISGGYTLAQTLHAHNVERIFCVAGESYLPVLDSLLDFPDITVTTCRHESGAGFMAESYAHLTGKPGIAFVTRGPGACNASIGVHAAKQSSSPMILFVGLINSANKGRESFQEFDMQTMFSAIAKHSEVIEKTEDIAAVTTRAFEIAMNDRPGPVVIGLPEEILTERAGEQKIIPTRFVAHAPAEKDMKAVHNALKKAQRPVIISGASLLSDVACHALETFSARNKVPVSCAMRCQDLFDHTHEYYIGDLGFGANPALVERIKEADLILALGTRLDEITTQNYTLIQDHHTLIHVHPCTQEFGKVYPATLSVHAHADAFIAALATMDLEGKRWAEWASSARQDYQDWTAIDTHNPPAPSGWKGADMTAVFRQLRDTLPSDAIVTGDAGNFSGWLHRYLRFGRPGRALSPVSGTMGYAVPSAVMASLVYPERTVLGICGDGGFMMSEQELATAIHHGAKPVIIVCNNNLYGTIRMHQNRDYPGRPHETKQGATTLTNPDFIKLAQSYGAFAARVEESSQFTAIWNDALSSKKLSLIEIKMDPRQISTASTLPL